MPQTALIIWGMDTSAMFNYFLPLDCSVGFRGKALCIQLVLRHGTNLWLICIGESLQARLSSCGPCGAPWAVSGFCHNRGKRNFLWSLEYKLKFSQSLTDMLRSSDSKQLLAPQSHLKTCREGSFQLVAPILWNVLLQSLRAVDSVEIWKKKEAKISSF